MEEWIAAQSVDGTGVAGVRIKVLLRVAHRALMNRGVLSRSEVVHVLLTVDGEVDGETTSVDEGHAATLLLGLSTSVHVFGVRIRLTLKLHELGVLETLPQGPLDNLTVTGDGDQAFTLVLTLHPLNIPNNISVLEVKILGLGDGLHIVGLDVVDGDVTT